MNPNLFKSAEFYQRRYHNFATLFIVPLVVFVCFLILFSLFAKKEITVIARGEITPTKIIASIQSSSNNSITINHLSNNLLVKKDELLIQYAETMENSQKQVLEAQLANLQRQKAGLETLQSSLAQGTNLFPEADEFGYVHTFNNFLKQAQDIESSISKTNTEANHQATIASQTIATIDNQINTLHQQIADYEELERAITDKTENLSAGNPHQATLNAYLAHSQQQPQAGLADQYLSQIRQSISGLESSIASLTIQQAGINHIATYDNSLSTKIEILRTQFLQNTAQELTSIDKHITDLHAQLEQATARLNSTVIRSPETGVIHLNSEFEGMSLIPNGSEIAQLYPNIRETKEVLITYYVGSESVSLLKEQQIARLSLETVGNQNITIIGKIQTIDQTATRTEQGNLFKITALAKVAEKDSELIQYGLQGRVSSIIAEKTYFDYYMDKMVNTYD